MQAESNINLHKIASNSREVVKAFDVDDRAKGIKDLDLSSDPLPLQRSLGMLWDLDTDAFTFSVSSEDKAFTKRGDLSVVNSLYDPLGLTAPITIKGKALLRELSSEINNWDEHLSFERDVEWIKWMESLKLLEDVHVPRVDEFSQARITVLRSVQQDAYKEELDCIKRGQAFLKGSSLRRLNPQVDKHGLLRVGGRFSVADLTQEEKHPVIVPSGHVSTAIIRHYHESVAHQGRHITEGAIRAAGFWVVGGKRRTCNVIKVVSLVKS
ncbi:hypothetical protein BSL78_06270 [Apostichopus japonicus]|uniref:Integrase zinc-binding domain-containing protein n=1 Tax=Stichopus japonicus TaxID=307972 RepID=A0A2G8L971_STIJA|nr:hypothetical protein BSL78_06270 [Apostichopus japonicus]